MTLMEFAIVPLDKGPSISRFVADVLDIVDRSGLDYRLTPMGTVVEGSFDELTTLLTRCFKAVEPMSERVTLNAKFDHRRGDTSRLQQKIESVESKLGRALRTQ